MDETIDVTTWLIFLTNAMADEQKWERLVAQLIRNTDLSREKVIEFLYALYEVLTQDWPQH